jgi:hypothetical protein
VGVPGVAEEVGTGSVGPTFGIVRPAVPNTRVDFSPYGQSVFADAGRRVPIPFGKGDCTVFRKVMSTEDTIQEFAPALRTGAQGKAFRLALQVLGDLVGLGTNYFDLDNVGYVKTATEVSSDNSALIRNIRKNENNLQGALVGVSRATMAYERSIGKSLPEEGDVSAIFDDSIIQDRASEKQQDMAEVAAGLM